MTSQPHNEVVADGQNFLVNTIVDDRDNIPIEVTLHWEVAPCQRRPRAERDVGSGLEREERTSRPRGRTGFSNFGART